MINKDNHIAQKVLAVSDTVMQISDIIWRGKPRAAACRNIVDEQDLCAARGTMDSGEHISKGSPVKSILLFCYHWGAGADHSSGHKYVHLSPRTLDQAVVIWAGPNLLACSRNRRWCNTGA